MIPSNCARPARFGRAHADAAARERGKQRERHRRFAGRSTFPRVKFLSRVLTALNLLPSIATLAAESAGRRCGAAGELRGSEALPRIFLEREED
jgi:hypothetical protein